MKILDAPQRSDAWYAARCGVPTASEFHAVAIEGRGRETYLRKLVAEVLTGEPQETPTTRAMQRGIDLEPRLRALYEFETGREVSQVGFVLAAHGSGCSPDGLVGRNGLWECKTVQPERLMEFWIAESARKDYFAQIQGQLWITEREWCDLSVFAVDSLPMLIERVDRDDQYIGEKLAPAVERLIQDRDGLVADFRLRDYGASETIGRREFHVQKKPKIEHVESTCKETLPNNDIVF